MAVLTRQEQLNLQLPKAVAVVGCGGVGSWCAYFLALAGVKELWLFDMDEISDHNLNRIPLPEAAIGKKKTEAVAELIHSVRPDCNALCLGAFTESVAVASNLNEAVSWIVATTDTVASRQCVFAWSKKFGASYIEAAAEGEYGSCTGSPAEWSTPQEALPGYASVPVWVGPCVFAAGVAVAHIIHDSRLGDRAIRMGWEEKIEQFSLFDSQVEEEIEETEKEGSHVRI